MQGDKHCSSLFLLDFLQMHSLFYTVSKFSCIRYQFQKKWFQSSLMAVLFEPVKNAYSKVVRRELCTERREKWATDERLHIYVKN